MKRYILFAAIALMAVPATAYAQAELMTKKRDIQNVSSMITKVVISGDDAFINLILEDEIERNWTVSPYEFCDLAEFEKSKCDTNYFFLIRTKGQYKNEDSPTVEFLSLLRGGPKAGEGLDKMAEVISLPFRAADDMEGRCASFLPAFINIIQKHIPKVTRSDISAYTAMNSYKGQDLKDFSGDILFCAEDISRKTDTGLIEEISSGRMSLTTSDDIGLAAEEMRPGTVVSYTIAPEGGRFAFNMLISTEDYKLLYFRKYRMTGKENAGFGKAELKKLSLIIKNGK